MSKPGSLGAKTHGKRYSAQEKNKVLALYQEHGPTVASRKSGIPYQTITRWARDSGVVRDEITPQAQVARSHAMASSRTAGAWADFREEEALAAGAAAELVRFRLLELLPSDDSQMLRAVTDAYDKLIANAERLSGQATERIQLWAQTDLDRELRGLVSQFEDWKRDAPVLEMPEPEDAAEIIEPEIEP
jgi:hypothetical protein